MRLPTNDRVCEFIALTLADWGRSIPVEPGDEPVVAWLRLGGDGPDIAVERALAGDPFRWYVYRCAASLPGAGTSGIARRPCGSLVGVLGALRRFLDIEAGGRARVVA